MIPFYHQRGPVHTEDLIRRFMERMEMWVVYQFS